MKWMCIMSEFTFNTITYNQEIEIVQTLNSIKYPKLKYEEK